jgi:hypothetical protein
VCSCTCHASCHGVCPTCSALGSNQYVALLVVASRACPCLLHCSLKQQAGPGVGCHNSRLRVQSPSWQQLPHQVGSKCHVACSSRARRQVGSRLLVCHHQLIGLLLPAHQEAAFGLCAKLDQASMRCRNLSAVLLSTVYVWRRLLWGLLWGLRQFLHTMCLQDCRMKDVGMVAVQQRNATPACPRVAFPSALLVTCAASY